MKIKELTIIVFEGPNQFQEFQITDVHVSTAGVLYLNNYNINNSWEPFKVYSPHGWTSYMFGDKNEVNK